MCEKGGRAQTISWVEQSVLMSFVPGKEMSPVDTF